ncbi:hypothetical protein GYMLUDRAFT_252134 [Collybiopsis luxurians FD-317 M1]|uniref:Uncharacterized protein n=1 Tax=Collybiopsis luxurians FD-317 M1 TaxID=944289 RepID=A0A0D0BP55_9AGAR|nr:hypothetical protein GYMLUDRAFT_252134 [Collybiopsis luxurians FD-317 M1]
MSYLLLLLLILVSSAPISAEGVKQTIRQSDVYKGSRVLDQTAVPVHEWQDVRCDNITECRTLVNILSSCLTVIFICVWVAIHPNVPYAERSPHWVLIGKLNITFLAVLAPELMVLWAMRQWVAARRIFKKYQKYGWTKAHAYLAVMGGFALYDQNGLVFHLWDPEFNNFERPEWLKYKDEHARCLQQVKEEWKLLNPSPSEMFDKKSLSNIPSNPRKRRHALIPEASTSSLEGVTTRHPVESLSKNNQYELEQFGTSSSIAGEKDIEIQSPFPNTPQSSETLYFNNAPGEPEDFQCLLELFAARGLITITEQEIKDNLNHTDSTTKIVAVIQTGWFVVQCIARGIEGIAITELEILTLAFALLNFAIYLLWWSKPLGVRHPIRVNYPGSLAPERQKIIENQKGYWGRIAFWVLLGPFIMLLRGPLYLLVLLPRYALFGANTEEDSYESLFAASIEDEPMAIYIATSATVFIFGGVHLLAWFFSFPTAVEQILWRVFALALTFQPILLIGLPWLASVLGVSKRITTNSVGLILLPLYAVCRIGFIVLAIMQLRALPDSAYQTVQWLRFIPHIG